VTSKRGILRKILQLLQKMSLLNKVTILVSSLPDKFNNERKYQRPRKNHRLGDNERIIIESSDWSKISDLKLEDNVSLADSKAAFLQGIVAYVGEVHFADGLWVGIQLTGPSIGKGNIDGSIKGKRYFSDVGRNNGYMAPIHDVHKRVPSQESRKSALLQIADLKFIDSLVEQREVAILRRSEAKRRSAVYDREEAYIRRLKELRLEELRRSRKEHPPVGIMVARLPKLRLGRANSDLRQCDFEFVKGLEMTQQNFCLSDPNLPDNPIVYASQTFLNMTGYSLNDVLNRNCRFLQGPETDPHHVHRIRMAIQQGYDCLVCLINYKADGSKFFNRCFIATLCDEKDRVKSIVGVQCEVSATVAAEIWSREKEIIDSRYQNAHLAVRSLGKYESNHSNSINWHDGAQEAETQSTWGSDVSLDSPLQHTISETFCLKKSSKFSSKASEDSHHKVSTNLQGNNPGGTTSLQSSFSDDCYSSIISAKDTLNSMNCDNSITTVRMGAKKFRKDDIYTSRGGRSSIQNDERSVRQKSRRRKEKKITSRKLRNEHEITSTGSQIRLDYD
jgi:PAS domain-containing protein